jgi:hypothetical protein
LGSEKRGFPMNHHYANVDRRSDGEFIIQTFSQSPGPWVADGPLVSLDKSTSAETLGTEAIDAVRRSRRGVRGYVEGDHFDKELLEHVGVKTYFQYMKGTRSVEVFADFDDVPTSFELTPFENEGRRGGYVPMMSEIHKVDPSSPRELGEAILAALEIATG